MNRDHGSLPATSQALGPQRLQVDTRLLREPPVTPIDFIAHYSSHYPPALLLRELVTVGGSLSTTGPSVVWPEETWQASRPAWAESFNIQFTPSTNLPHSHSPTLLIVPHNPSQPSPLPALAGVPAWQFSAEDSAHLHAWTSTIH